MFLENHGVWLGVALLGVVIACAILLGRKATQSVEAFRDEHYDRFQGPSL